MTAVPTLSRRDVWARLTNERGRPLRDVSWTGRFRDALDDRSVHLVIVSAERQVGKTTHMTAGVASTLFTRPGAYVVFVSAAERQADAIFTRKLRRPIERLARDLGVADLLRTTNRTIEVPDLGTAFEFMAPNEATAPARSVDELYIDEARDVPDPVFEVLAPSVIGVGGKIVLGSTAGRPTGFFYELVKSPPEGACLIRVEGNENPEADAGVRAFLTRLYGLFPAAARRELANEFTEGGDVLIAAPLIDDAIDDRLGELPSHVGPAFSFLDLGRKRDLSSLVTVVLVAAIRPEAGDHLVAASVLTWDPKQSPTGEVDFAEVRAAMDRLPRRFPGLVKVLVDEGAEAGSVLPWARQNALLASRVEGFTGSVATNMGVWSALLARFNARTISVPRHERLLAELRGLRREEFSYGSRWRVVDGSRRFHRDVSLALAGAVMAAGASTACPHCIDRECEWPLPPMGLMDSPHVVAWFKAHPDLEEASASAAEDDGDAEAGLWERIREWVALAEAGDADAAHVEREIEEYVASVERTDAVTGRRLRVVLEKLQEADADA